MRTVQRTRAGRVSPLIVFGAVLWTIVIAWFLLLRPQAEEQTSETEDRATDSAAAVDSATADDFDPETIRFPSRQLPDFEFDSAEGDRVSRDSLKGAPWVASFVFTRCMSTCPQISLAVKQLHDRLAESRPDVRFVSFTVDPNYDTPDVLQQYAEVYSADPERWRFLTGEESKIHELILTGFAQFVKPNVGESRRPGFEVAHTNRVVLVNEDAIPVATFLATRPEDMVRLRRILEGKDEFPQPGPPAKDGEAAAPPPIDILRPDDGADEQTPADSDDGAGEATPSAAVSSAEHWRLVTYQPVQGTQRPGESAGGESQTAESVNQRIDSRLPVWAARLPAVNAGLNLVSTVLLISGFAAIRTGRRTLHRNLMISAFTVSVLFLAAYLTYHSALGRYTGEHGRAFAGPAWAKPVYSLVLWPHVALAAAVPFLSVRLLWLAWKQRWTSHRRLARWTFPIWLYVSVTGVLIYLMLYHWPAVPDAGTAGVVLHEGLPAA